MMEQASCVAQQRTFKNNTAHSDCRAGRTSKALIMSLLCGYKYVMLQLGVLSASVAAWLHKRGGKAACAQGE